VRASICKFMPAKDYSASIKTVNFVYETELKKLRQPFFKPIFLLNLVTRGKGEIICDGISKKLDKGFLFFNFPGTFFEIKASSDFEFAYISFMGDDIDEFLERLGINNKNFVFEGFGSVSELWLGALRRLDDFNANILTESVLLYTLSFFGKNDEIIGLDSKSSLFSGVLDYIDKHITDSDMSLRKVSGIFAYSQKYFSYLFKENIGTGFCEYINEKRMERAKSLITDSGVTEVSRLSELCGFTDPLYFSKVFKKYIGASPSTYIKNKNGSR